MIPASLLLFLLSFSSIHVEANPTPTPYLSPTIFFSNYQKMLDTFKIFIYQPQPQIQTMTTPVESLFHTTLLSSSFVTTNGDEAHLLYLPIPPNSSARSISRSIRDLRTDLPFWNRTLGADHFYLSSLAYSSDRNFVELKKNAVQISPFPSVHAQFIPHKDLTLPGLPSIHPSLFNTNTSTGDYQFLCLFRQEEEAELADSSYAAMVKEIREDKEFSQDASKKSRFCLFFYGKSLAGLGEAMREGCVPVVVSDRPIVDLPFMDVLRWSDMAVFVGVGGGVEEVKRRMVSACSGGGEYEKMRETGKKASRHLVWNERAREFDAFHTVLYQLWSRRHTIRYATWELF